MGRWPHQEELGEPQDERVGKEPLGGEKWGTSLQSANILLTDVGRGANEQEELAVSRISLVYHGTGVGGGRGEGRGEIRRA